MAIFYADTPDSDKKEVKVYESIIEKSKRKR